MSRIEKFLIYKIKKPFTVSNFSEIAFLYTKQNRLIFKNGFFISWFLLYHAYIHAYIHVYTGLPQPHMDVKVTTTTFWLKCKNLLKCTKFCSIRKLEVAAKNFGLLTKIVSCIAKYGGLRGRYNIDSAKL